MPAADLEAWMLTEGLALVMRLFRVQGLGSRCQHVRAEGHIFSQMSDSWGPGAKLRPRIQFHRPHAVNLMSIEKTVSVVLRISSAYVRAAWYHAFLVARSGPSSMVFGAPQEFDDYPCA